MSSQLPARTKRVILQIYDQMTRAAETGQLYQTVLNPPPVELDLAAGEPSTATVAALHPRAWSDRPPTDPDRVVEEMSANEATTLVRSSLEPEGGPNGAAAAEPTEEALTVTGPSS